MGKYSDYQWREDVVKPWTIHPVWRGVGCIMALIIPILSYTGAVLFVRENIRQGWFYIPYELAQVVFVPFLGEIPYLYSHLIISLLFTAIGFGALTVVYTIIYKILGPPMYGPFDTPPLRKRRKR